MKKIKKSIISMFMAFVLMFSFLLPIGQVNTASAQAAGQQNTYSLNDDYDTVYYFSDHQHCYTYKQNLLSAGIIENCVLYDWVAPTYDFYASFNDFHLYEGYADMGNSYIIFELTGGLELTIDNPYQLDTMSEKLFEMFDILHHLDSKIMFICGTDELLFEDNNEFLQFVDIHINIDTFTVFMSSIFYHAAQDVSVLNGVEDGRDIDFCTFILDASLAPVANAIDLRGNLFEIYFLSYIRMVYRSEIEQEGKSIDQILDDHYIIFLFVGLDGTIYQYSEANGSSSVSDEQLNTALNNTFVYAIGTPFIHVNNLQAWLQDVLELREEFWGFPIYAYQGITAYLDEYDADDVYRAGTYTDYYHIIVDFLSDEDLTVYHNWAGEYPIVTHKAMVFSEDGWMVNAGGMGYGFFCWEFELFDDDFDYFFPN